MENKVNIDVNSLETQICPECECPFCFEIFKLRYLPALLSPNGKEQWIKESVGYACTNCKTSMFQNETKKEMEKEEPKIQVVK